MDRNGQSELLGSAAFLWPALIAAEAGRLASALVQGWASRSAPVANLPPLRWATSNRVALELPTMRLRDFSIEGGGRPVVICAPYSLHRATIADFARGHSLVQALLAGGIRRVFLTEWRSATPDMRFFSVDTFLADLNVAVDELGGDVDLVGICQGGWLGVTYAARFPGKIGRLVLAGAPIDIAAGRSVISMAAATVPLSAFEGLVALGEGRILGRKMLGLYGAPDLSPAGIAGVLQIRSMEASRRGQAAIARFHRWYADTVDLPGTYYLETVQHLFRENRLAEGRFVALGRQVDLASLRKPLYLLAAEDDELVAPGQLFGVAGRVGTPSSEIRRALVPGSHMSLFAGAETLTSAWPPIVRWLRGETERPDRPRRGRTVKAIH
jgi:poly(3-hydroxyalkanoate) synthetase